MQLVHISHTDLDGYGCQYITKKLYKDPIYYNANYGLEVKLFLKDAINQIKLRFKNTEVFLLITDLNLTPDEAKQLNNEVDYLNNNGYKIKLQLLDHHKTGQKSANRYEWYFLDISRSATMITFDYFNEHNNSFKNSYNKDFKMLIEAINAVDIWLEDQELFEFGKVCLTMISKSYEINNLIFAEQSRMYKFHLLDGALKYISTQNNHINLDENLYFLKKEFLNTTNQNDTIDNLSSSYLVKSLENKKDEMTIYYNDHKGLLTYGLGSISIPANAFLKANPDFHFFIDINKRGRAGLRANNKLDVSLLAQKLCGGGGHPNASGMAFDDFKEEVLYENVREFIQLKLDNCI